MQFLSLSFLYLLFLQRCLFLQFLSLSFLYLLFLQLRFRPPPRLAPLLLLLLILLLFLWWRWRWWFRFFRLHSLLLPLIPNLTLAVPRFLFLLSPLQIRQFSFLWPGFWLSTRLTRPPSAQPGFSLLLQAAAPLPLPVCLELLEEAAAVGVVLRRVGLRHGLPGAVGVDPLVRREPRPEVPPPGLPRRLLRPRRPAARPVLLQHLQPFVVIERATAAAAAAARSVVGVGRPGCPIPVIVAEAPHLEPRVGLIHAAAAQESQEGTTLLRVRPALPPLLLRAKWSLGRAPKWRTTAEAAAATAAATAAAATTITKVLGLGLRQPALERRPQRLHQRREIVWSTASASAEGTLVVSLGNETWWRPRGTWWRPRGRSGPSAADLRLWRRLVEEGVHLLVQLRLRHGLLGALAPLALSLRRAPRPHLVYAPRPHPRLHLYGSQVVLHSKKQDRFYM